MPAAHTNASVRRTNKAMFWRIIRRLLGANRGRLLVMLLALGAGAAVTAALLNLQVDAQRRLTTEFRAFGPNIILAARHGQPGSQETLDESVLKRTPTDSDGRRVAVQPLLYVIADASADRSHQHVPVVVAGRNGFVYLTVSDHPHGPEPSVAYDQTPCVAGSKVAAQMGLHANDTLALQSEHRTETCLVSLGSPTGGPEDNQVAVPLTTAQKLAALPGRISLAQITATGTPKEITGYIASLRRALADVDVRPIRQFTEGEAKIYNRISGVLTATIGIVLILTALCVMAAMTNVAMERRNDVGLMKAVGGATRRVLRLFLTEAALLGIVSGLVGAAVGILLSMWLGKSVFGIAARPRLIVYPVAVALTTIVAILGAYPLRRLANIRPASVFRGEA
jgi:putative ABC transport system permease protein